MSTRLRFALATMRGALWLVVLVGFPFALFAFLSLGQIFMRGAHAQFVLGTAYIPKFLSPSSTNLSVLMFSVVGLLAVVAAVVARYLYHRKTLLFLRRRGVYDYDKDGRTDSFADGFLDDL
jgi:hypothetical protein